MHETNAQQAHYLGYYELLGMGAAYDNQINEKIMDVTSVDIMRVAKEYLNDDFVISLLAPEKFLQN